MIESLLIAWGVVATLVVLGLCRAAGSDANETLEGNSAADASLADENQLGRPVGSLHAG